MNELNWGIWALLLALQGADVLTTAKALRSGGREANLIMEAIMRKLGAVPAMCIVKAVGMAAMGAFVYMWAGWITLVTLLALCALYVWVVAANLSILRERDLL